MSEKLNSKCQNYQFRSAAQPSFDRHHFRLKSSIFCRIITTLGGASGGVEIEEVEGSMETGDWRLMEESRRVKRIEMQQ